MRTNDKLEKLKDYLRGLGSAAIAFSGGVDSTFLLKAAQEALGDKALALTARSPSFPKRELDEAIAFCKQEGIPQIVFDSRELEIPGFSQNPPNRCYLCKKSLFETMLTITRENFMAYLAEGSNLDDEGDYRPGLMAVEELGVKSPLRYAQLSKAEIRELSKTMGLPTWEKPSFACLLSRFPYGEEITLPRLSMIDRAEQLLLDMGFHQVRARCHGDLVRIETGDEDFQSLVSEDNRKKIHRALKEIGFAYVSVDLLGYRTGSMNETLSADVLQSGKTLGSKEDPEK